MIYTIIYEEETGNMGTCTFVASLHDKNHAWNEFKEVYAKTGWEPIVIIPGNHLVYFSSDISFTQVA
jgi:hypothetical protein